MKRITILLADDHMIVREGFRKMLELEPDLDVVGEAQDGRQAVAMASKLGPAVVLMDIGMPKMNGLEATRQLLKAVPSSKVVMLTAHSDDAYVEHAIEAGAVGFLLKQASAHDVCQAIREVQKGHTYFSPAVATRMRHRAELSRERKGQPHVATVPLSSRELEVLQLIAEGQANKQIAGELGISTKTVEKHRDNLMHKLNIHDTAGVTRYAISAGIIECDVQLRISECPGA